MKKYNVAEKYFNKGIKYGESNHELYCNRGKLYLKIEKYSLAIDDFKNVLGIQADHLVAHQHLGSAYSMIKDYKNAIIHFSSALNINPDPIILYRRGMAHDYSKQHKRAVNDFDAAINRDPDNPSFYLQRGIAKFNLNQNDYEEALNDINYAIQMNEYHGVPADSFYFQRGIIFGKMGDHIKAIHDFERAIQQNNQNVEYYLNRGIAKANMGYHYDAIKDMTFCIDNNNIVNPRNYLIRGIAHEEINELIMSRNDIERGIRLLNNDTTAMYKIFALKLKEIEEKINERNKEIYKENIKKLQNDFLKLI